MTNEGVCDERAALELEIFEGSHQARASIELATVNAELERIERKLEPMVLEWQNRYEMFRRSCDLLDASRRSGEDAEADKALTLYGSSDAIQYAAHLGPQRDGDEDDSFSPSGDPSGGERGHTCVNCRFR